TEPPVETPRRPWEADLIVGLPIALRLSRQLYEPTAENPNPVRIEFGLGAYTIVPSVFLGVRWDRTIVQNESRRFAWRPGLDFYYSPVHTSGGLFTNQIEGLYCLAADAEFVYAYRLGKNTQGTVSSKLGIGAFYAGGGTGMLPLPILGLSFGMQF
ncbi:MAG: hypothetical protein ACRCZF_26745, partial [Gemmataceae bacterium]